jgi:prevent-host-death family protein
MTTKQGVTMKTVSAAEANRRFSILLRAVAQGEHVTVVSRGKPVASIQPFGEGEDERRRARSALVERLNKEPVTGEREWAREDLYD